MSVLFRFGQVGNVLSVILLAVLFRHNIIPIDRQSQSRCSYSTQQTIFTIITNISYIIILHCTILYFLRICSMDLPLASSSTSLSR